MEKLCLHVEEVKDVEMAKLSKDRGVVRVVEVGGEGVITFLCHLGFVAYQLYRVIYLLVKMTYQSEDILVRGERLSG